MVSSPGGSPRLFSNFDRYVKSIPSSWATWRCVRPLARRNSWIRLPNETPSVVSGVAIGASMFGRATMLGRIPNINVGESLSNMVRLAARHLAASGEGEMWNGGTVRDHDRVRDQQEADCERHGDDRRRQGSGDGRVRHSSERGGAVRTPREGRWEGAAAPGAADGRA